MGAPDNTTTCSSVPEALGTFFKVQEERAVLYSRFHAGFKAFLLSKQEVTYRSLMAELTPAFSACSQRVRGLQADLDGALARPDLAALLNAVQEGERDKLRLTLELQALKQAYAFKTFSWQHRPGGDEDGEGGDDDGGLLEPGGGGGHEGAHHHGCGCGHGADGGGAPEPSKAEYEGAVREALQRLDLCIGSINDALMELRYELEDA